MLLAAIFLIGYLAIVFEHALGVNKAATALLTGVACWTAVALTREPHAATEQLVHHLGDISQVVFFLLGALTIVELIDAHHGFDLITARVRAKGRKRLLVIVVAMSFLLSAVLDNLTTAIVMMSFTRKILRDDPQRHYFGGLIIIAANAGGVWSPIGDVTTTMLWVGGQITATRLLMLVVPACVSALVPALWIARRLRGSVATTTRSDADAPADDRPGRRMIVLVVGGGSLLFVPVFKTVTHLPPFMGVLLGLSILWVVTEILNRHHEEERHALSVAAALQRIDSQSVLFFVGILLAVGALESAGLLGSVAASLHERVGSVNAITIIIGLASSIVDNVPLVAAAQGMYSLSTFPVDHHFWLFLAYCAGTGGSILIIGSAAGIAVMGIERITFGWYLRHMTLPALAGFAAGAVAYLALAGI